MDEEKVAGTAVPPVEPTGGPQVASEAELAALRQQVEDEKKKAAEAYDQYLRSVAELRNYKKRVDQEREQLAREASAGLILRLLPVMDDFDRAMAVMPDEQLRHLSWIEGIVIIYRRLQAALEQSGLRPIVAAGQRFDPYQHEAIIYEEAQVDQEGIVLSELQKGYRLHDRVLRPTLVKVGKAMTTAPQGAEGAGASSESSIQDKT